VPRSAVAIALPRHEFAAVSEHLSDAGYEAIAVDNAEDLERVLSSRDDVRVAILDGELDFDGTLEMYGLLHEADRNIPALMLMPSRAAGRMGLTGSSFVKDEYFTRPYSAESLRWRVEAMLIRVENVPAEPIDGRVAVLPSHADVPGMAYEDAAGKKRGRLIIVFNPKGGVGKTTISINLGAILQIRKRQRVLIVDCDTITGHVASSLGLSQSRTLAGAWRSQHETGIGQPLSEIAIPHPSGVDVLVMSSTPLRTEVLEPKRVSEAIAAARSSYDFLILDMHPDYGPLNQALFELADRILVPVTPDVPCIRAAVQFREVAAELGIRDRLSMVINRANSGVAAADVERVVGLPTIGRVRSAGMLFVRAADQGKSAVERFPSARVVGDLDALADRLLQGNGAGEGGKSGLQSAGRLAGSFRGLFGRLTAQV
jgi:MinD-like ATPase involved in chromosome partitioning or flagellar assembly